MACFNLKERVSLSHLHAISVRSVVIKASYYFNTGKKEVHVFIAFLDCFLAKRYNSLLY